MDLQILVYFSLILLWFVAWVWINLALFRMGKYVRKNYPDRYDKQLTSSKPAITELFNTNYQFPFPFNLGRIRHSRFSSLKKISLIAEAENDRFLLAEVKKWTPIFKWTGAIVLVIMLTVLAVLNL